MAGPFQARKHWNCGGFEPRHSRHFPRCAHLCQTVPQRDFPLCFQWVAPGLAISPLCHLVPRPAPLRLNFVTALVTVPTRTLAVCQTRPTFPAKFYRCILYRLTKRSTVRTTAPGSFNLSQLGREAKAQNSIANTNGTVLNCQCHASDRRNARPGCPPVGRHPGGCGASRYGGCGSRRLSRWTPFSAPGWRDAGSGLLTNRGVFEPAVGPVELYRRRPLR